MQTTDLVVQPSDTDASTQNPKKQTIQVDCIDSGLKKICGGFIDDLLPHDSNSISDNSSDDENNSIDLRQFDRSKNKSQYAISGGSKSLFCSDNIEARQMSAFGKAANNESGPMMRDAASEDEDDDEDDVVDDVFGDIEGSRVSGEEGTAGQGDVFGDD